MLNNIVKHAAQVLDSSSAWLYLSDQNPDEFRCKVSFGENGDSGSPVLPSGEGLLGEIVQQATALIIPDFQKWPGEIAPIDPEKIQTVMGAPVVSEGNIKGVLILSRPSDSSPFTSNDLELLEIFANQVSTALEAETLGKSKQYRRDVLAALHEASIRLTSSSDSVGSATMSASCASSQARYRSATRRHVPFRMTMWRLLLIFLPPSGLRRTQPTLRCPPRSSVTRHRIDL